MITGKCGEPVHFKLSLRETCSDHYQHKTALLQLEVKLNATRSFRGYLYGLKYPLNTRNITQQSISPSFFKLAVTFLCEVL